VHRLNACWRDHDGQRDILSHNGCRQVAFLERTDDMWREAELTECIDVVGDGDAFLAGGQQCTVDGLGQPLLGPLLGERHRLEPLVACHG
jgi:hypothetical protein